MTFKGPLACYVLSPSPELWTYPTASLLRSHKYVPVLTAMVCSSAYNLIVNANVSNSPSSIEDKRELAPRALANGAALRILCLGASITFGYGSSDGNGYRYALRGALVQGGSKVNMIGSVSHGNMNDNQVEAWPGYRIAEVDKKAELSLPSMPNVVLIFVGSNYTSFFAFLRDFFLPRAMAD